MSNVEGSQCGAAEKAVDDKGPYCLNFHYFGQRSLLPLSLARILAFDGQGSARLECILLVLHQSPPRMPS